MSFQNIEKKLAEFSVETNNIVTDANKEIRAFESLLGKELPHDYRKFLSKFGECYFSSKKSSNDLDYDICYTPVEKDPWMGDDKTQLLESFYGLGGNERDIRNVLSTYSDRFPRHIISIAASAGGNEICLDLNNGNVLFWDHESSNDKEFYLVANSFEDFILSFEDEVIEDSDSSPEIEILNNDFAKALFEDGK
ncbi:SMI1/KNR4 family protein [Bacillus subtilis]|uniref:SMI1/KNR4 family protein n=1 Tax=Bacillus subtilis TaxID=1423 RepID=UPI003CF3A390